MKPSKKIIVEVLHKADYCLPCFYMEAAIQAVLPRYQQNVDYRRVNILAGKGKQRFLEISCELFGEEAVKKHYRLAPVPALLINGELVFDQIPPEFELIEALEEALKVSSEMTEQHSSANHLTQQYHDGCKLIRDGKISKALIAFDALIANDVRFAEAYFQRGVCHTLLGHNGQAARDLDAATLLGCRLAQIWSRFDAAPLAEAVAQTINGS